MNGHTYIMTLDGFIYESQFLSGSPGFPDITSWNTIATVTASQYPDRGIGIYRFKHLLLAFGQDSVEFFSADNNAPPESSLVRTDQAFIKFGAIHPKMVVNVNDVIYWIAYGSADTVGLWKLDGYAPIKVSTPKEDYIIGNTFANSATPQASLFTLEPLTLNNTQHIVLNGISNTISLVSNSGFSGADTAPIITGDMTGIFVYNVTDNTWWLMNGTTSGSTTYWSGIYPATTYVSSTSGGTYVQMCFRRSSSITTGHTNAANSTLPYIFGSPSAATGAVDLDLFGGNPTLSVPYCKSFQTNTLWFGNTDRKRVTRLTLMTDTTSVATTKCYLGYSTNQQTYKMVGVVPHFNNTELEQIRINNCGSPRNLSVAFACKSVDFLQIWGIAAKVAQGVH